MKSNLLNKLTLVAVFFTSIAMSAQQGPTLYEFTTPEPAADNLQGWVKGYGNGTVGHDQTGGETSDGAP